MTERAMPTASGNESDIELLAAQARHLEVSFGYLNDWYIGLIAITAILGVAVFASQYMVIRKGRQLSAAQSEIITAKDRQLAEFQSSSRLKIAEAERNAAEASARASELEFALEKARNDAKVIDTNLLNEQRLTARERWRLERLERAVLPRSLSADDAAALVVELKEGHFPPINLAIVAKTEPMMYGLALMRVLQQAEVLGELKILQGASGQFGVAVLRIDEDGDRLGQLLWQKFRIGGGIIGGGGVPTDLRVPDGMTLPTDGNCLLVGENDAALQPGDGQPGEGLDENGRPVPASR